MRRLHYIELGATLFIPAHHHNILPLIQRKKIPYLKSMVIDFEDGVTSQQRREGLDKLEKYLDAIDTNSAYVFIRPKDPQMLKDISLREDIQRCDGFVLPKFSLQTAPLYLEYLDATQHMFMPSFEGLEVFENDTLQKLFEMLLPYKERIVLVRFGLEDLYKQLLLPRECATNPFDISSISVLLGGFIAKAKLYQFGISGGVYGCFEDEKRLRVYTQRDLNEGLFSKTTIHPKQIGVIHDVYKVDAKELEYAKKIVAQHEGVGSYNGQMIETATMQNYADLVLQRAKLYGIRT